MTPDGQADASAILRKAIAAARKVDLTHRLEPGMPSWQTHPKYCHRLMESYTMGHVSCHHALELSEHTGTHFDAPIHFIRPPLGWAIDQTPVDTFFGRMLTIDCRSARDEPGVSVRHIADWEQRFFRIEAGDAVFFHFGWDSLWYQAPDRFLAFWPGLSGAAATYLADRKVRIVGCDCLSIDPSSSQAFEAHLILLGAGILIGENFNNLGALPPVATLVALPLAIAGGSGSPLRAIALM